MGLILLDSTVIVGFLDADDALYEATVARVKEIVGSQPLAASVSSCADGEWPKVNGLDCEVDLLKINPPGDDKVGEPAPPS